MAAEATAEMLGRALGRRVSRFESVPLGRFSCEVTRIEASLADGEHLTLVLKRPLATSGRTSLARERDFYQRFAGRLDTSPGYYGYLEAVDGILLEWLPDLVRFDWRLGPQAGHAEAALHAMAALHRLPADDLGWPESIDTAWVDRVTREYDLAWPACREILRPFCPAVVPLCDDLIGRAAAGLERLGEPGCLLHGDAHGENLPVRRGGGVCLLDWQDPIFGHPGVDVADFLVMSFPIDDRRRRADELLARHAEAFGRTGYDALTGYRLGVLQRLVRTVRGANARPEWQNSSLPWIFERCAVAALDADVGTLVG